ncbi:FAD/NAD(P)-binding protein [Streptomyces sp. PSKA54]|uniref:FAD/NAD(P)-binding protein n=1 Tax=Streptomyces himalayensis subsp. aureolus TaxID=2758039 RepID=A0A7W2D8Y8_9ACTN|nr:FAD/NAD(P)-binding protein [Streptomyces himalayensis]MBA4866828.1 FAD/NAD(P)-binding protein [Streptomyces himalayensis subsp. aureolus]
MSGISIGVVGGGASAVCLIDALAQAQSPSGNITVFEPSPNLWRGRAYQIDVDTIKVNAPPDDMSVRVGDLGHFERWLEIRERIVEDFGNIDPYSGMRFAPRTVYGEYLEQSAYAALGELRRKGWRVDLVGAAVTAARRTSDQVLLSTSNGSAGAFDYVVLCVGGDSPTDAYGLTGVPGFIADPYPMSHNLRQIGAREDVAVIGSGLTAVDIILALAAQGHQGRISLLSRRGVLPGVRQRPITFEPRHLTKERMRSLGRRRREISLADFAGIVEAELRDAGADLEAVYAEITHLDKEKPVDRLRRQFAAVGSSDPGLRILQRAVPDIGPDVWPLLREEDQAELLRSRYRTIMSLCCPMPPSSASMMLELIDAGQLDIRSGLHKVAARSGGGFEMVTADGTALGADKVVNAVNASEGRIPTSALPLVTTLTRSRAAGRHPHGGLRLARATSRLIAKGTADPRLYGLGNIGAGALFFTFGIPSLVDRSEDIVASILQHAGAAQPTRSADVLLPA